MKLYIIPGACSLAVNIALREAGIHFDLAKLDPETGRTDDGKDFQTINPKGYVPALQLKEVGLPMSTWPRLESYRAGIAQRPHVLTALQSEA